VEQEHSERARAGARGGRGRRRWPAHVVVPALVAAAVGSLLLVAAGGALAPTREVVVRPVVFGRDGAGLAQAAGADRAPDRPRPIGRVVQAPGWLEADPYYIACTALADGVVREILALEGERVEAGQVVARLVAEDAELSLAQAEADLAFARSKLIEAEANSRAAQSEWDHPVQRDRMVETTRARLDEAQAELAQLPSLVEAEHASLEAMREELRRQEQALTSGAINELEVIVLRNETASQAARLSATEQRRGILEARVARLRAEVRAAERDAELRIEERRALDFARAHRADAAAGVARAEAVRDEARLRLDRMTIHAPISGFVQRRLKAPGDKVMLGMDDPHSAHLLHLYDPETIQVRVDVPLADAAHVFVGQRCEVIVDVLPETPFAGEVTRVTHEADLQKNTLQAKVRVIDPSPLLRPEMLTRVKFLPSDGAAPAPGRGARTGDAAPAGVRVPERAIARGEGGGASVWVVRDRRADRGLVRRVEIEILATEDGWATARGDLRPGDLLAVGAEGLTPGQRVRMVGAPRPGEKGGA
jgi:HlyD family secretion protein